MPTFKAPTCSAPISTRRPRSEASARARQVARVPKIMVMTATSYRERIATIRAGIGSGSNPALRTVMGTAGQDTIRLDRVGPGTVGTGTLTPAHSTGTLRPRPLLARRYGTISIIRNSNSPAARPQAPAASRIMSSPATPALRRNGNVPLRGTPTERIIGIGLSRVLRAPTEQRIRIG